MALIRVTKGQDVSYAKGSYISSAGYTSATGTYTSGTAITIATAGRGGTLTVIPKKNDVSIAFAANVACDGIVTKMKNGVLSVVGNINNSTGQTFSNVDADVIFFEGSTGTLNSLTVTITDN